MVQTCKELLPFLIIQNKVLSSSTVECSITEFFLVRPRRREAGLGVCTDLEGLSSELDITTLAYSL